jgi:hypothetical protein
MSCPSVESRKMSSMLRFQRERVESISAKANGSNLGSGQERSALVIKRNCSMSRGVATPCSIIRKSLLHCDELLKRGQPFLPSSKRPHATCSSTTSFRTASLDLKRPRRAATMAPSLFSDTSSPTEALPTPAPVASSSSESDSASDSGSEYSPTSEYCAPLGGHAPDPSIDGTSVGGGEGGIRADKAEDVSDADKQVSWYRRAGKLLEVL